MSRTRIVVTVLVSALAVALLVPTAATGAAAILKVVVTNTSDNPVPIRGTVNVSGPAPGADPVPVTGSVAVQDDREPFETRVDINLSASEPFDTNGFQIPEGKRLVVQFIGANATVPDGQTPLLSVNAGSGATGLPIPLQLQGVGNGNAFYRGGMAVTEFHTGFYSVGLERQLPGGGLPGGSGSAFVYIAGYLVPAS
jgi:hypothetical protein